MSPVDTLFRGKVRHRRFIPKVHAFTYPVYLAYFDIDHIRERSSSSRFVSYERFNAASFYEKDFLPHRTGATLRERLEHDAFAAGKTLPKGPVFLLAQLRAFGASFNPVSYYYAFDEAGVLAYVIAEVTNTPWLERTTYWMVAGSQNRWMVEVPKAMHVSPFNPMALTYQWTFDTPSTTASVGMKVLSEGALHLDVDLELEARPWSDAEWAMQLLRFPFSSLQVLAAIHWQALRLWLKRVPVQTHPKKLGTPKS